MCNKYYYKIFISGKVNSILQDFPFTKGVVEGSSLLGFQVVYTDQMLPYVSNDHQRKEVVKCTKFEVLMAVLLKIALSCDVTLCHLLKLWAFESTQASSHVWFSCTA